MDIIEGQSAQRPLVARYKVFRNRFATWDALFHEAAAFATRIGPDRLISISHSCDSGDGVIAIWYWDEA